MNEIYQEVNKKMAQTYWLTDIPNSGKIFVNVKGRCYVAYFYKKETGWGISEIKEVK